MEIKGKGGSVRVGGRSAATLGEWSLEGAPTDWTLHAELLQHNPLWLAGNGPHELRLSLVTGYWRWRDVPVQVLNGALYVTGKEKWTLVRSGLENRWDGYG